MKIITRAVLDWDGKILEEESHDYQGPLALCGDARNLADLAKNAWPLIPCGANASAPSTASGSWVDMENYDGDLIIVVDLSAVTGTLGSLKVQLQSSSVIAGTSAANETGDPRNSGLLTITATGVYAMPYSIRNLASYSTGNCFVGVTCTYTGITAATFGVSLLARARSN